MFSRASQRFPIFPWSAEVAGFRAFASGYMFSRAWQQVHVFPRLAPVTYFPALGSSYMFSRPWQPFHVFPRLPPVSCFHILSSSFLFSRVSRQWHVSSVCVFSRAWQWIVWYQSDIYSWLTVVQCACSVSSWFRVKKARRIFGKKSSIARRAAKFFPRFLYLSELELTNHRALFC